MTSSHRHVEDLVSLFDRPQACAAELLCDRHPADAVAFTVVEPDLSCRDWTFGELRTESARLATALAELGAGPGDRVATLLGKSGELVVTVLAIWRIGAAHVPLFTALAPPAIATRLAGSGARIVVTEPGQRAKLGPNEDIPAAWRLTVITTGTGADGDHRFDRLLEAPPQPVPVAMGGDATLVELFTSGTTGAPKGVPVPLWAVSSMLVYQEFGLDHQESDVFWNAADPGWAYGLYHAIIGPLGLGRRSLMVHSGFSPALTWAVLDAFRVTNFTAGPTVYRALRAAEDLAPADLALRHCSSAGEPLPPEVSEWAEHVLGIPVLDHYGQTELGMAVANAWHPGFRTERRPGSMGRALPGWRLEALRPESAEPAAPGERGRLAVDLAASPLMWFTGYRGAPGRTAERFTADRRWYLTGDTASKDADGNFRFTARDDDIILMAGYRIGPSEVESVLLGHPAVAEAAVVGVPDELRGEVVAAHVVLRAGRDAGPELAAELQDLVKTRFAAHAYPRIVHFVAQLPKTPSGKLQRSALRIAERHSR
ncbi:AMP-binding protein [Amycolatopsis vastitatis]|uniref:AMP-dependent synthetase n=1 Tax=Amycolatopsis vastitatis TaxID=1905142 RepID=A0A229SQN2_9PSEU|nr:AMP-binding protein [Amycolatopsis vastitatis]OXM61158.1 AMP-dependent synthetase [Amycolatopsis vastitatis]